MKYYTDEQLKYITDNGKYKRTDDENYSLRVLYKYNYDDHSVEYRIGDAKASFYTFFVKYDLTYKELSELLMRLFELKGINKQDISLLAMMMGSEVNDPFYPQI